MSTLARIAAGRPRYLVAVGAIGVALVATLTPAQQPVADMPPVQSDAARNGQGRQVSLKDQLRVGLKAVTKADFAFIDLVVLRVNQGKLPRKLVDSTFFWARNRYKTHVNSHRLRPIVYFQPALTMQAKKIGVLL